MTKDKKGLKTKLDFRFNVDDIEIPEMNFESDDPTTKEETQIKTVSKKKKDNKQKELF
jgi:hypothetical protein